MRFLLICLLLLGSSTVVACGSDEPARSSAAVPAGAGAAAPTQDAPAVRWAAAAGDAVRAVSAGDARLLDVRTRAEWDAGHARGAVLLPLAKIEAGEIPGFAKRDRIFVYCASGRRAAIAVARLRRAGFKDVTNIGGLVDWRAAGGPLA